MKKTLTAFGLTLVLLAVYLWLIPSMSGPVRILVFSKTAAFYHSTIPVAKVAIQEISSEMGIAADTTTDASLFTDENLKEYSAVVFLHTTGDVLTEEQQQAFMRFIQAGGSYVGIHSATDTEYGWPWYGSLVGGYFVSHPNIQEATLSVVDRTHPATVNLPASWVRTDEWYNMRYTNQDVNVLITIDESLYDARDSDPAVNIHPLAWNHEFDGGRSFYTALGHVEESYSEPLFRAHIKGGLEYAVEPKPRLDYNRPNVLPAQDGFQKRILDRNLNEPMELDRLPDGRILFIERRGDIKVYDPSSERTSLVQTLDVNSTLEDGLLGLAVDPDYFENKWIYLYYSPPGSDEQNVLSRFMLSGTPLKLESERQLLTVKTQRTECCHSGGSVEFGPRGLLYLSTGDNTNPFASDGYSPQDERPGRGAWDAQRTSANTYDLRGKILRIRPTDDGAYEIPTGNLFATDGVKTRPEIYVMGNRNPFRISIDRHTGYLYWGEVGPDATDPDPARGPRGHDEINQAREAGFFGWPYFVGDNKPYFKYDFATQKSIQPFDAEHPLNQSPNNSGLSALPAAQPAFIWYPYGFTPLFPLLGDGGRTAIAGPVYHYDDFDGSDVSIPRYYDGKLFVLEWMRHMIFAVTMDANGRYAYMERFGPDLEFSRPTDMIFGSDGAIYLLEYGANWNARNEDARLVKIEFAQSN